MRRHSPEPAEVKDNAVSGQSRIWAALLVVTVLLAIVAGGSTEAQSAAFFAFRLLCVVLMAVGLVRLLRVRLSTMEVFGLALAAAAIGLVSLHLLPLPFTVFSELPGREFAVTAFSAAGISPRWMPLSLNPEATRASLLALLPPAALFVATLSAGMRARWAMAAGVLAGACASAFLGLLQRLQGATSGLYLYEISNFGSATGFFSNRNNFAILLCVAVPLTWGITLNLLRSQRFHPAFVYSAGAAMMIVLLTGIAASNSRSGILLGMLALALSAALVWTPAHSSSRRSFRNRLFLFAVLGGALVIGQFGMVGILRVVETDPLAEYRADITRVTLRAAASYFPVGSGFGTFRDVYAMHETPATMLSAYVNHAHNDWLELWLEGGLPAASLMACLLALFLTQTLRMWRPGGPYASHILSRAANVGVLVLLAHSFAEYPLRMPALLSVFAILMAFILTPPRKETAPYRNGRERHAERPAGVNAPHPDNAAAPVFRVKPSENQPPQRPFVTGSRFQSGNSSQHD